MKLLKKKTVLTLVAVSLLGGALASAGSSKAMHVYRTNGTSAWSGGHWSHDS